MNRHKTAVIAAILGNAIWGGSFLFSKVALEYTQPVTLLALRFAVAFCALNIAMLLGRKSESFHLSLKGKNLRPMLLLGIFQPVSYFFFEAYGIRLTNSTFSSVMIAMIPICALIFEAAVMKLYPTKRQTLFAVLSVGGVVVVSIQNQSDGALSLAGVVCLLLAIASALCYGTISRQIAGEFSVFERTYFMFTIGFVFYLVAAFIDNFRDLSAFVAPLSNLSFVGSILYLGVISSVVAFGCVNYSFGELSVSQTTVFNTLTTVVAIFCGTVFLREPFGVASLIGSAMIITGLFGFNSSAAKQA